MNQEKLRQEFFRLTKLKKIKDCSDLVKIFLNYFLQVIIKHQSEAKSKADAQAIIINQMIFAKIFLLKNLIKGINFHAEDRTESTNIIDPTIVASNLRNLYETVGMFNLIYINTKTDDEKTILYNLWVSAGLKFRQRFKPLANTDEHKNKIIDEQKQIAELKSEIENTELYKSLNKKEQRKIQTKLNDKDYKIQFKDNKVMFLNWQNLVPVMGIRKGIMDTNYTYLSLYSHPSNVSVFQFGEMFSDSEESYLQIAAFNFKIYFFLLSIFIKDYITLFPNVLNTFNNLIQIEQLVINDLNGFARNEMFSINDTLKDFYSSLN